MISRVRLALIAIPAAAVVGAVSALAIVHSPTGPSGGAAHPPAIAPCQLPVLVRLNSHQVSGFVHIPNGTLTLASDKAGYRSYDWQLHRWLFEEPKDIAADGRSWAYVIRDPTGASGKPSSVHVFDVRTGKDRVAWIGTANVDLVGYTPAGVVMVIGAVGQAVVTELFDPATGASRPLPWPLTSATAAPDGGVWSLESSFDRTSQKTHVVVRRYQVGTVAGASWLDELSDFNDIELLGFDQSSHPILRMNDANRNGKLIVLAGPGKLTAIATVGNADFSLGQFNPDAFDPASAVADTHGIWSGARHGRIWLYTPSAGLHRYGELTERPEHLATVAGPCK